MHPILTQFIASLISDHIEQERQKAFEDGKQAAKDAAAEKMANLEQSHAAERSRCAQVEGELADAMKRINSGVWELRDHREAQVIEGDPSIYGPNRFPATDEKMALMRREVAQVVADGLLSPPTEDQWGMILSSHPATCVVAGGLSQLKRTDSYLHSPT